MRLWLLFPSEASRIGIWIQAGTETREDNKLSDSMHQRP
jgi:hypothetical protein